MPNRILREGIIESEAVNSLSPPAEILFRRLMSKVDDFGRYHGHPQLVLAACYPLQLARISLTNVSEMIAECAQAGLIQLYEINSKKYLEIRNFGQRTRCDSKFPAPCSPNARAMSAECSPNARAMSAPCAHLAARATTTTTATASHTTPTANARAETTTPPLPPAEIPQEGAEFPSGGSGGEYPLTLTECQKHDPAVDAFFVLGLVQKSVQACISAGDMEPVDDEDVAAAVRESYAKYTGRNGHGVGLLTHRVPQILLTWGKHEQAESK